MSPACTSGKTVGLWRRTSRRALGVALAACLLGAGTASAQPANDEARRLYDEGRAALDAGRFDEACEKLSRSYRLSGSAGALLSWADCEESRGRLATALSLWKQGSAKVVSEPSRREFAERRIAALDGRVPRVELEIRSETREGLVVRIDGGAVDPARQPYLVDPGSHELTAEATGQIAQRTPFRVAPGETVRLMVFPQGGKAPVGATRRTSDVASGDTRSDGSTLRTAGWVAVGVGAAGAIAAGVTGLLFLDRCDGDLSPCGGVAPTPSDKESATRALGVAQLVSVGIAVLGLGGGALMIGLAPRSSAPSANSGGGRPRGAPLTGVTVAVGRVF